MANQTVGCLISKNDHVTGVEFLRKNICQKCDLKKWDGGNKSTFHSFAGI